jgi:hypothetical protein
MKIAHRDEAREKRENGKITVHHMHVAGFGISTTVLAHNFLFFRTSQTFQIFREKFENVFLHGDHLSARLQEPQCL